MALELDGKMIAALVSAGWTPPEVDYEAWRPALSVWNAVKGWPMEAERVADPERELNLDDRTTINVLAAVFPHAPKVD